MSILEEVAESHIQDLMAFIGENPYRKGLTQTPKRVRESWKELFEGYSWSEEQIQAMMTTFDGIPYDGIVLMRDIEFYSFCEHHWLPFYGKAHIAYIPGKTPKYDEKVDHHLHLRHPIPGEWDYRVVGLSKLARLLDVRSRRFQVQENITTDVTSRLDKYLKPLGSACIIEAKHMCVCSRGVGKQHSEMVTASMTGTFFDSDGTSRNELYSLINRR